MPYSAQKVANRLLGAAQHDGLALDPLKLLKLVYIAHGWSLAYTDRALVRDRIEAWEYGPVIPSLYQAVRGYRYQGVPGPLYEPDPSLPMHPDDERLIQAVYNTYRRFSGGQLSNMTHQPETPWATVWNQRGRNSQIDDDIIRAHYRHLRDTRTVAN